jgi:hypothetical protein
MDSNNNDILKNNKKYFTNRYYFYKLFKNNNLSFNNFIMYIVSHFNLNIKYVQINENKVYQELNIWLSSKPKKNDYQVYTYLRQMLKPKVEQYILDKSLKGQLKKVEQLYNFINKSKKKITISKILDIGTENIAFLDEIGEKFKINDVNGLNIDNEDSSYEGVRNKHIQIYDGINFNFSKKYFDLVTIISVMHHIDQDVLSKWIKNVCKITKSIYIKDNGIANDETCKYITIQHELYEGILYSQKSNPLNVKLTYLFIKSELKKNKFTPVKI